MSGEKRMTAKQELPELSLIPLREEHRRRFQEEMQEAFQQGARREAGGPCGEGSALTEEVLPEEDIDESLRAEGAAAYEALLEGRRVGGAIVVIDQRPSGAAWTFSMSGREYRAGEWDRRSGGSWRERIRTSGCGRPARRTLRRGIFTSM